MSYIENLFTLQSRVAIVTGGTGVLGSAMCKALANAGAAVVILGRRKDAADQLAQEIGTKGGIAMGISADVLNKDQLIEARQSVLKKFGRIDILVNGAGGNMPGAVVMPDRTIFDLSIDDFKSVVDLNLTGSLLPTQIFGEPLAESKQGVIINISSMTAI
ncbi:MAG TPA: SDR family NAD(P)-dependent oxidoreductase, partial [Cyclobacteriaceae bacterium]|nr:SDR family NAD(P)-dependent oxidoreductase [Cyclobacteriaceae bacterium]